MGASTVASNANMVVVFCTPIELYEIALIMCQHFAMSSKGPNITFVMNGKLAANRDLRKVFAAIAELV
jgi:hypothetical protein